VTPEVKAVVKPLAEKYLREFVSTLPAKLASAAGKNNAALGVVVGRIANEAINAALPYAFDLFDQAADHLAIWLEDVNKAVNGDDYPFVGEATEIVIETE
jgi:hypothetical protein